MKRLEQGASELVISSGDSAADLQVTDRALDAVALAIHAPVPADFGLAIGFGRNAATDAGLTQAGADDWRLVPSQDRKTADEVQTI
jgi:hypothetical protein